MISLKKYLEASPPSPVVVDDSAGAGILQMTVGAYRSALLEMGSCSVDASPALGEELKLNLIRLGEALSNSPSRGAIESTEKEVCGRLQDWGRRTAHNNRKQAEDVKGLLIVIAHTAESVGERDQRCAGQISEVTCRLEKIASLEDLTEIRASIEKSAAELKTSVERMATEGKAAIEHLRAEVSVYRARLEEAEELSSRDGLTGVRSRQFAEGQIARRIAECVPHCIAVLDIDGFKRVNDEFGHLVGDELLKQFAGELQSACRPTDVIARWGGDEFLILLDSGKVSACAQTERVRQWVCGNYKIHGTSGSRNLKIHASIGLAEHMPGQTMKDVIERADAAMYKDKEARRSSAAAGGQQ